MRYLKRRCPFCGGELFVESNLDVTCASCLVSMHWPSTMAHTPEEAEHLVSRSYALGGDIGEVARALVKEIEQSPVLRLTARDAV